MLSQTIVNTKTIRQVFLVESADDDFIEFLPLSVFFSACLLQEALVSSPQRLPRRAVRGLGAHSPHQSDLC